MKKIMMGFALLCTMFFSACDTEEAPNPQLPQKEYGDTLIAETMKVPEHYRFTDQSESGKSKVSVDADVVVPEVYGVDVWEAIPTVFTDEEAKDFVERHTGNFEWENAWTQKVYSGEGLTKENMENGIASYSLWLTNQGSADGKDWYRELNIGFWVEGETGDIAYTPTLIYRNAGSREDPSISEVEPLNSENQAEDCTISLEQAIAFGEDEVQHLFPDFFLSQYGQLSASGGANRPQYYVLKYTRSLNGIPVNMDTRRGVGDGSDYTAGTESVWMTVNDDGVCWLEYDNPMQTGKVVEGNVELLSFDAIMDIFEKVSILSIQHLEVQEDLVETVMDIKEIRFGYMAVRQSESIGGYRYVPVWDFYGIKYPVYEGNTYYPQAYDEAVFTINAMDGTVIDRNMGY